MARLTTWPMCGARPFAISVGLILEEGLPMGALWQIVQSMQAAAAAVGVPIVTGDTKVVDRGKGDGIYINTTGIGKIPPGVEITPRPAARPGDRVRSLALSPSTASPSCPCVRGWPSRRPSPPTRRRSTTWWRRCWQLAANTSTFCVTPRGGLSSTLNEIAG